MASPAKPKQDYKDKERQATTRDGEPVWTVRLDAIEPEREARETIWVEVAGDQPRLTFDGYAVVHGLVFAPWVGRDGKIQPRVPRRVRRAGPVRQVRAGRVSGPARQEPSPTRDQNQETLMTSIHIYDPADGTALPELPPLPIGVLAVGTAEPAPAGSRPAPAPAHRHLRRPGRQPAVRPGAGEPAGHHPLGAALRQRRDQPARTRASDGPETWCRTEFDYYGIAVTAYAHIPAAPASI